VLVKHAVDYKNGVSTRFIHRYHYHPFLHKLEDEGMNSVLSWTADRGIYALSKKFIYVPIHRNEHWPLMVLINPGWIDFCDECNNKTMCPCMLHLDGLGLHDSKGIAGNLRCWLYAGCDRKHNSDSCIYLLFSL
jgi:Ulp1 family protease